MGCLSNEHLAFFKFFFGSTGVELRVMSFFCFSYFSGRVLCFGLGASLEPQFPTSIPA
jgi:hypothetical protein